MGPFLILTETWSGFLCIVFTPKRDDFSHSRCKNVEWLDSLIRISGWTWAVYLLVFRGIVTFILHDAGHWLHIVFIRQRSLFIKRLPNKCSPDRVSKSFVPRGKKRLNSINGRWRRTEKDWEWGNGLSWLNKSLLIWLIHWTRWSI